MEPFSFVFMYSLLIAGFAYFVLTKKDLTFEGARRRAMNILFTRCRVLCCDHFICSFNREAQRRDFNSKRFKELANKVKKSQ